MVGGKLGKKRRSGVTYEVLVELKKEVLDPEGRAITQTLGRLGFNGLKDVKVTRRYLLDVDESDSSPLEAGQMVEKIAHEYLANPVSETFTIRQV